MLFGQSREELRRFYHDAWQKRQAKQVMQPLEHQVADVIALHPEYQALFSGDPDKLDKDYIPDGGETNPFLHMGMHLAIREQVNTDRPSGIRNLFQQVQRITGSEHDAEHRMMDCLGEMLWQAQRNGTQPDEQLYLACLRKLI